MNWIKIEDQLPTKGQVCDIWVKEGLEPPHRRIYYVFTHNVGVTQKMAFQHEAYYNCGLYEMAFFLDENIVTHWMPSPEDPTEDNK